MFWPDIDDADYDYENLCNDEYTPRKITCKYCKKPGFIFVKVKQSWMLQDKNGSLHTCVRDARQAKIREESKERAQIFHEVSVVMNGENPSVDDINRLLHDAASSDKHDMSR